MKQQETKRKEQYEAPSVFDIEPVTPVVRGNGLNDSDEKDIDPD